MTQEYTEQELWQMECENTVSDLEIDMPQACQSCIHSNNDFATCTEQCDSEPEDFGHSPPTYGGIAW